MHYVMRLKNASRDWSGENMSKTGLEKYSSIKCKKVIIPDDVLIRDGISCGDNIIIQGAVDDDILSFSFSSEACIQCEATLGYLYSKYNKKNINDVVTNLTKDLKAAEDNFGTFCHEIFGESGLREKCVMNPLKICKDFFEQIKGSTYNSCSVKNTKNDLDCDACVSTGRVNWRNTNPKYETQKHKETTSSSEFTLEYRKTWMPLAKTVLTAEEIATLRKIANSITYDDVIMFSKLKIEQMIFFNITKYCKDDISRNPIWKNIFYRQYRSVIVKQEIDILSRFIADNNLSAYFVKGAFMQLFYTSDTGIRNFLDYDILASSSGDAFQIATFLFRRGFKIFYSEFSIKYIQTSEGDGLYTGHFHLQKLVYNQYKIIIDINFPGFPMGRISLYFPLRFSNHSISNEDEFIITLCHLFKHKDVFMKDINDLYFLLNNNLDFEYLKIQIERNKLEFFFSVAAKYIIDNYDLPDYIREKLSHTFGINTIKLNSWPYDYNQVYNFKRTDLDMRNAEYVDNNRIYLFPLAVFSEFMKMNVKLENEFSCRFHKFTKLDDNLYKLDEKDVIYWICGMGIFWDYSNNNRTYNRLDVTEVVNFIIEILGMQDKILYLPYYLTRQEKWFD